MKKRIFTLMGCLLGVLIVELLTIAPAFACSFYFNVGQLYSTGLPDPSSLSFKNYPVVDSMFVDSIGTMAFFNSSAGDGTEAAAVNTGNLRIELAFRLFIDPTYYSEYPFQGSAAFTFPIQLITTANTTDPAASADIVQLGSSARSSSPVLGYEKIWTEREWPYYILKPDQYYWITLNLYFGAVCSEPGWLGCSHNSDSDNGFLTSSNQFHVYEGKTGYADLDWRLSYTPAKGFLVPEPTSFLLLGTGLAGIGIAAWRKRK